MSDRYNGQYFTNTYSLWGNSRHYNINNLSPRSINWNVNTVDPLEVFRATKCPEEEEGASPEPPYVDNTRMIERHSLLVDPVTKTLPQPLWGNSKYYDFNTLSPRSRNWNVSTVVPVEEFKATKCPEVEEDASPESLYVDNIRMIERDSMLEDPVTKSLTPPGQYFTNTYSLWGNSKYFDFNALSPRSKNWNVNAVVPVEKFRVTKCHEKEEDASSEPPYVDNIRMIERDALLEDPVTESLPPPGQYFTNTYSLWGNSKYYDFNALSPRSRNWKFKASKCPEEEEDASPEPSYVDNIRMIERDSMLEDPITKSLTSPGQYFTNTYSLWGNSKYYDINNLSPRSENWNVNTIVPVEKFKDAKCPEEEEGASPEPPYVDNIRMIERDSMLEDPVTKSLTPSGQYFANTYSLWGNSKYFDFNALSPRSKNWNVNTVVPVEKIRDTKCPEEEEDASPEPPYVDNIRMIERDSLLVDPVTRSLPPLGNSKYYDFNALSPGSRYLNVSTVVPVEEFRATKWPDEEEDASPEPPYIDNIRVIERDALLVDPATFCFKTPPPPVMLSKEPAIRRERYWYQSRGNVRENLVTSEKNQTWAAQPSMEKAINMMQKMGWHGGPLGKSGEGIVEPIVPNEHYDGTKIGLGHKGCTYNLKLTKSKKICSTEYFDTNVLLHIFEFLKNNNEVELLFDRRLKKNQRKRVHDLVKVFNKDDLAKVEFKSYAQMELVLRISEVNCYVLVSQSHGELPYRQLSIYKEAPSHVYLIIPEDLRGDDIYPAIAQKEANPEEEPNPFLISITRNLTKQKTHSGILANYKKPVFNKKSENNDKQGRAVYDRIVGYFKEFAVNTEYTQLKFLGNFNHEEKMAMNDFVNNAFQYLNHCGYSTKSMFSLIEFSVEEDVAGNTMIQKLFE